MITAEDVRSILEIKDPVAQEIVSLVLDSGLTSPEKYALGKESVYMKCSLGHKQNSIEMAEYFKGTGHCLYCEALEEKYMGEELPTYD